MKNFIIKPILLFPQGVQKLLGISSTQFFEIKRNTNFPQPRKIDSKRKMFLTKDIEEWANNLEKCEDEI